MAEHAQGNVAGQREGSGFSKHVFFAVIADAERAKRARRIEEYVVAPVIARSADSRSQIVVLVESNIDLQKPGISDH